MARAGPNGRKGPHASGWRETYMGPAPRVPTRNHVKRPARLMVRNLTWSPGAKSRSRVFQFQVLSTRRRWRPGVTGIVTVPPYMSSATGLPSSFTMIWRSWISSGDVRRMVICASGAWGEAEDMEEGTEPEIAVPLLLEKVLEGLAGVVVARRGRRGGRSSLLRVGSGCGVFFHGGAKFVEGAVVLRVFGCNALRNRLRAFKLRAAVEEAALFATVQLESALGTLAIGVEAAGEHRAAIGTARAGHGADHARRSRTELIGARTAL